MVSRDLTATDVDRLWDDYYQELNQKFDDLTEACLNYLLAVVEEVESRRG